jgi:uncharacterized protein YkwD
VTFRFCFLALILSAFTARAESSADQILDEVNFARTQPAKYAQVIAAQADKYRGSDGAKAVQETINFLQKVKPQAPLALSPGISQAALSHALDMGPRGGRGHTGSRGETPWKRMSRFGAYQGYAGENIDYGHTEARAIVVALIVDYGVSNRLHRKNLFSKNFRVTGIAVAPHSIWGSMCVMDFATGFVEGGEERVADRMATRSGFRSNYSGMSFF